MTSPGPVPGGNGSSDTEIPWTDEDLDGGVFDRFLRVAAVTPDRIAVADTTGQSLTYDELARVSRGIAGELIELVGPGAKVALLSNLSTESIAGLLGIIAAGCAYVPVDWTEPAKRVGDKLNDAGATAIVVPPGLESLAREMAPDCRQLVVDAEKPAGLVELARVSPEDHFNLIYTSGSTGQPKGVIQNHKNVLFDTRASFSLFPVDGNDRIGLVIPLTFGASVSDVAGALLNGAGLELFDLKTLGVDVMAEWMAERRITVTHLVPTILRRWLSAVEGSGLYPEMKLIKAGGEPVFPADLELFTSRLADRCLLRNGLGTTETYLVAAGVYASGDKTDTSVVPVGSAAPGRTVTIVDSEDSPLQDGEIGEIHVTSAYLSPGYWKDPEATAASFFVSANGERTYRTGDLGRIRPDGQLEHLGRVDDMVKVMGQRVHLTDVENAISEVDGIVEASVVAKQNEIGDTRLMAFVVASDSFAGSSVRSALIDRLPPHMVPARFVFLEALPTLPFGKIDRRALAMSEELTEGPDYRAPSDEMEEALASAATAALGLERVGVDDDLFALGLDSLSAVQLTARARAAVGRQLDVGTIFDNPTIATLAEAIRAESVEVDEMELVALLGHVEEIGEDGARQIVDSGRR